ncbi:hypothetical protein PREVCOP_04633 [Segatella copri DSM 18205]|uniref:Uncharacterized protein n=1 Tax=Segatella copri DSM 18205 TaxID=537011 RepID=D1PBQ4_9BACT|nr:hypothetical protein PREVCOP_04633 [Segatella copri DSM 18205]
MMKSITITSKFSIYPENLHLIYSSFTSSGVKEVKGVIAPYGR